MEVTQKEKYKNTHPLEFFVLLDNFIHVSHAYVFEIDHY